MEEFIRENFIVTIIIGLLCVCIAVLCVRIFQYKSQLRQFTMMTRLHIENRMDTPMSVDYFQKEILELAMSLNEYTRQLREDTLYLEQEKDRLNKVIAGISHDFRTPLTAARGYMQMVKKSGQLDEKNEAFLQIGIDKIDYLKTLSDAFFEVAYDAAKEEVIETEKLDIVSILTNQLLGQYEWILEKKIETDFQIPEKEIYVVSNRYLLERILDNLFSNCEKYTVSKLRVALEEEEEHILISIENDSYDVEQVDVERIFELFYRDSARTKEGSGIGLYIVKKFAQKLGHKVFAKKQDDKICVIMQMEKLGKQE